MKIQTIFQIVCLDPMKNDIETFLYAGLFGFFYIPYFAIDERDFEYLKHLPSTIWSPFICYYNYLLFSLFFNLYEIISLGLGIIAFCVLLVLWGLHLEKKSKNPLKGLLDSEQDTKKEKFHATGILKKRTRS